MIDRHDPACILGVFDLFIYLFSLHELSNVNKSDAVYGGRFLRGIRGRCSVDMVKW